MYWSVVGAFVALEYVAEWFISWFPFYWELKTIILLFLSLPQTQGSTWVYKTYLDPLLAKNEAEIDAGITAAQTNILNFVQVQTTKLWDIVWRLMTGTAATGEQLSGTPASSSPVQSSSTPNPFVLAKGMWNAYGPSFLGSFQASQNKAPTSVSTPDAQRPHMSPAASSHSAPGTPSFPEPQHYQ